jgi:hypothetical protein
MPVRKGLDKIEMQNSGFGVWMEANQVESRLQRRNVKFEMSALALRLPRRNTGESSHEW